MYFFLKSLTSSPRASSISLFSLSPGPMCLSAKSSCLGSILSICLEEAAADVLRPRAAVVVVGDAALCRILHWSFQTTRLLSLTRLHGAPGFTDLAMKIPQDLAQLCISKSLRKTSPQEKQREKKPHNNLVTPCPPLASGAELSPPLTLSDWCEPCRRLCQLLQTAEFIQLHGCTRADQSERGVLRDAVDEPRSNSC